MKIINRDPRPVLGIRRVVNFSLDHRTMIAAGGCADVHLERGRNDRPMVIKIDNITTIERGYADYFIDREAALLMELDHPNIVKCLAHGRYFPNGLRPGRLSFLALEYFRGWLEADQLIKGAADRAGAALFVLEKAAAALVYLHGRGLVHADIKPNNILTDGRTVKVIDFAAARPEGERLRSESRHFALGMRSFKSLSRLKNNPPTKADDIFALGIMAGESLLGKFIQLRTDHFIEQITELTTIEEAFGRAQTASGKMIADSSLPEPVKELLYRMIGLEGRTQFADAQELSDTIAQIKAAR